MNQQKTQVAEDLKFVYRTSFDISQRKFCIEI